MRTLGMPKLVLGDPRQLYTVTTREPRVFGDVDALADTIVSAQTPVSYLIDDNLMFRGVPLSVQHDAQPENAGRRRRHGGRRRGAVAAWWLAAGIVRGRLALANLMD